MGSLQATWSSLKVWRSIPLGPVSLMYRFGRSVRVSNNLRRRWLGSAKRFRAHDTERAHEPNPHDLSANLRNSPRPRVTGVETALLVGVGPGLGFALARTLVDAGMSVAVASRDAERLDPLVNELNAGSGARSRAYGCDAQDERSVSSLMSIVTRDMGVPHLVIYSVQGFCPGRAIAVEVPAFEECWRRNCLGGFIVAREAARKMAPLKRGTIVLVGSTSALVGRADHLNIAVGKFGLRAVAQVMARELWPEGIHVAHCVIDADIREVDSQDPGHPQAQPEQISAVIYALHRQERSCWTSELDVRPWNEQFWEHC